MIFFSCKFIAKNLSAEFAQFLQIMSLTVKFDHERRNRTSVPEAVFCEGKPSDTVLSLLAQFAAEDADPVLFTRLDQTLFSGLSAEAATKYQYCPVSRCAFNRPVEHKVAGSVALVSAGTSDARVLYEAAATLKFMNTEFEMFEDCGVAGLWRLQKALDGINRHNVIIAAAGMEAALISVLAGLSSRPIIGVPVSNGYGVCEGGKTALNCILASCAPGVSAVNIDNGFGAACFAYKILSSFSNQ